MSSDRLIAGRYRLTDPIGTGAMGVVWRATDVRLRRTVAVKQLLLGPGLTRSAAIEAKMRAMREGRIAARLHHPNAVTVFDVAEEDGQPWLVMEYVNAVSLAALMREKGRLEPAEVARIGAKVAAALAAAHKAGIVHRDVKPANILVADDGTVKITDFGISRATGDVTVTSTGFLAGTPAYLSPEVARGENPEPASDVFALGSTLYAAVEGAPPFGEGDNPLAVLHSVARAQVPVAAHAAALWPVLIDLLAAEADDRPTMEQAAERLQAVADGRAVAPLHATKVLPVAGENESGPGTGGFGPRPTGTGGRGGRTGGKGRNGGTGGGIAAGAAGMAAAASRTGSGRTGTDPGRPGETGRTGGDAGRAGAVAAGAGSDATTVLPGSRTGGSTANSGDATEFIGTSQGAGRGTAPGVPVPPVPFTSNSGAADGNRRRLALIALGVAAAVLIAVVIATSLNRGGGGDNPPIATGGASVSAQADPNTGGDSGTGGGTGGSAGSGASDGGAGQQPPRTSAAGQVPQQSSTVPPSSTPPPSSSGKPTTTTTPPPTTTPFGPPNAAAQTAFVQSYYGQLPGNVNGAWAMLSPGYQAAAGGFNSYSAFFGQFSAVSVSGLTQQGDTVVGTVTYTHKNGYSESERRWFRVTGDGGRLVIADSQRG